MNRSISTPRSRSKRYGAATVEMTLVGIPIIFTLVSIFEMSRGMWMYQTLAYSVKAGVRFAIVHGASCDPNLNNQINDCRATVGGAFTGVCPPDPSGAQSVAVIVECAAVGLDTQKTLLTFSAGTDVTQCYLEAGAVSPPFGSHPACTTLTSLPAVPQTSPYPPLNQWPPPTSNENAVGQAIQIDIQTPFRSAISMFWPEAKRVSFTEADLGASSKDDIQF